MLQSMALREVAELPGRGWLVNEDLFLRTGDDAVVGHSGFCSLAFRRA